jgi:hypothetical protein
MTDDDIQLFTNMQNEMLSIALMKEEDKTSGVLREFAAMIRIWAELVDKAADERENSQA